ncbi:MAG TPA: NlpC/P60 family protein [Geodermatophilus sp.]|nr:NlpC/P60 family protein [Geodermatophilus sp.]
MVVLGVLVLPLVVGLLLPGPQAAEPNATPADPTGLALTAQSALLQNADRYRGLLDDMDRRRAELDAARQAEQAASAAASAERASVGSAAADLYRRSATQRIPLLGLSVADPAAVPDVLYHQAVVERAGLDREAAVVRAGRAQSAVEGARQRVAAAEAALADVVREAEAVLAAARAAVSDLDAGVSAHLAALGSIPSPGPQQERNQQALRRWQEQLGVLADAGIDPPLAEALADPEHLPPGLSPALDSTGQPIAGIAWAVAGNQVVTVLPAETVAAVSSALSQLGRPYVPGTSGPDTYDCGGLTSAAWLLAGHSLPGAARDQWSAGAAVPIAQLQVGDLVFTDGGTDVGIYLGEGQVLGASAAAYQVGVRALGEPSGAVRVTLPAPARPNAPLPVGGGGTCGAEPAPAGPVGPAWGGWTNGRIPATALCPIGGGHLLRCDAAASYAGMAEAYAAAFGRDLCITDSYRPLAAQASAFRRKPALAAVPGTSNHGWALAVDLCGGINVAGTPQWTWMTQNAGRFGFVQPDWASPGGEKPEPWHWEYGHPA